MVLQAVNLDTLQNFLAEIKVAFSGIVAIVAEDGTLIAHTNKEIIKEQKKIPENLMKRISRDIAAQTQNISSATEEQSAAMQEISSSSQGLASLAGDLQQFRPSV